MQAEEFEIIKKILDGEIESYRILVERYKGFVFSILSKRLPYSEIDEVAQNVFIGAFKSINTFSASGKFKNWLAVIAARETYEYWKRKEREKAVLEDSAPQEGVSASEALDILSAGASIDKYNDETDLKYYTELSEMILKRLNPEDRTLVETIYFEGWKLKDAAAVFKWGLVKTKIRAMRARNKMRNILSEILDGDSRYECR